MSSKEGQLLRRYDINFSEQDAFQLRERLEADLLALESLCKPDSKASASSLSREELVDIYWSASLVEHQIAEYKQRYTARLNWLLEADNGSKLAQTRLFGSKSSANCLTKKVTSRSAKMGTP